MSKVKRPRVSGITLCIDTLEPLAYVRSLLKDIRDYIDYVRIGWGLNFILSEERLKKRIKLYHDNGIEVCTGGTAFFIVNKLNKVEQFFQYCRRVGFDFIEIAEGVDLIKSIEMCEKTKFRLMVEVGEKERGYIFSLEKELAKIEKILKHDVEFVVIEGRADGTAGIYNEEGSLAVDPIEQIERRVPLNRIIIEAPRIEQQIYFINKYGPEINFGNIHLKDAATLETLRKGLKFDTRKVLKDGSICLEQ